MVLFDSKVVGIYGVSGCGKSYALAMVQQSRPEWRCIDGSQLMREIVQEQGYHWHEFDSMPRSQQEWLRCLAAKKLQSYQGVTLVAGHGSFPTADDEFEDVFSSEDGATYDAIFYLEHKQPDEIAEQRRQDNTRPRPFLSEEAIGRWMQHEKELTRRNCANYNICFVSITELDEIVPKVQELISLTMRMASSISHGVLHRVVKETIPKADVFLLFDGDRTLCPQDTGELFVKYVGIADASRDPMKQIFQRHNDYCFEAFLEVAIWIERVLSPDDFSRACKTIAEISVAIHPGLIDFLKNLPPNVRPVLVSSGVIEVWRCVLEKNGLADKMDIIASSHIGMDSSAYIVDVNAKGHVVTWLKEDYPNSAVWAFGDSAVDAMMLEKADRSFVVLDDRNNRSLAPYLKVWRGQNKKVFQIDVFGAGFFHPCIEIAKLDELAKELATYDGGADCRSRVIDISTECMAALVLATQSRRSDLSGLALQQVHVEAGKFLADHWMNSYPDTLLEIAKFGHVQGNQFAGPVTSSQVMIVPLMRGGEPLARGVFERFPRASFVHYFEDEKGEPSDDRLTNCISKDNSIRHIAIVDSVINEGNSVRRVLNRITNEVGSPPRFRISVLTLVIQEQASVRLAEQYPSVRFVTLRTSQNKYKGKGGTDTGNRLFGTM